MYPTIVPGDRLLCNKVAYDEADPARGDIILFPSPARRRQTFIKRVVALAGETVEIRAGLLYVNGPAPLAGVKGRADYLYCPARDWSRFGRLRP